MPIRQLQYGLSLHQQGRLDDAAETYRQVLKSSPRQVDALNLLGQCMFHLGDYPEAARLLKKCLKEKPDFSRAHRNLADVMVAMGDKKAALQSLARALALDPSAAELHCNRGSLLYGLEQFEEAISSFRQAIEIEPALASAHRELGLALIGLGRTMEAEACFRHALALQPDFVEAHNSLGNSLFGRGCVDEAEQCFRRAVEIAPDFSLPYANLANCAIKNGWPVAAERHARQALEHLPKPEDAWTTLSAALQAQGRHEEAISLCAEAIKIRPGDLELYSSLLFSECFCQETPASRHLEQARQFGRMVSQGVKKPFRRWNVAVRPDRLRVGMVSGDFRNHPVGFFLEGVLGHLDPARIELFAYSTVSTEDELTERIRPAFGAWKSLVGKSHEQSSRIIHEDGIHVLIDLSGHTASNRLPLFAWKPAPVQVSWLGYFSTTGVAEMDYLIADAMGVPASDRSQFTESVWYLPDTRLCYTPPTGEAPVAPLPSLGNGYVTFGCFQHRSKISDAALAAWSTVLAATPGSRLRFQNNSFNEPELVARFLARCRDLKIDSARISFVPAMTRAAYLAAHGEVDLILDTFPFTGGTTTCDALWMGVPTLTLAGSTLIARQGASLLAAAGLPEWIAGSEQDYVDKAIRFAGDPTALASLRAALRQRVLCSPLFDAARFASHLTDALWGMWREKGVLAGSALTGKVTGK